MSTAPTLPPVAVRVRILEERVDQLERELANHRFLVLEAIGAALEAARALGASPDRVEDLDADLRRHAGGGE